MKEIAFNKSGIPLIAYGDKSFVTTTGSPEVRPKASKSSIYVEYKTFIDKYEIVDWGTANNFPLEANDIIRRVGVLSTGLKFTRNFTLGQGIYPCRVTGYNPDGSEILEIIMDKELISFCQGRMVRRYLEKTLRDYLKFGCANVHLIPDQTGTKMVGIEVVNTLYCRYTVAKAGIIEKCIVSGLWPDSPGTTYEAIDILDDFDPAGDLDRRRMGGKIKGNSFVFAIKDSWSNNDYYPEPAWYSAYLAGWIDIAAVVPKFLAAAYKNQITWKWHIQIPYAFWDKKFPEADFATVALRQAAISTYMDTIEDNLCGSENANKPIFTFFEVNPTNGKAEEQWIITALDNKYKEGDKLITSAAANSEILFSLMINPNVLGAGMPGGTYAGNQGGSNIREAFLVNIANAWLDRQNILDPLEAYLEFNGVKDVQLRFANTILTTLDTGSGSKKTLS